MNFIKRITSKEEDTKFFSVKEVEEHKIPKGANQSIWIVIHDKVYDVTTFLDKHPAGAKILIEHAGQDSTKDFEDVGHSTDAKDMMKEYLIGEIRKKDRKGNVDLKESRLVKDTKFFSVEEVEKHKIPNGYDKSIWLVIHHKVYDVTKFLDKHPGGEKILVEHAGQDSTKDFEHVGHSTGAKDIMKKYLIGEIREDDRKGSIDIGPKPFSVGTRESISQL